MLIKYQRINQEFTSADIKIKNKNDIITNDETKCVWVFFVFFFIKQYYAYRFYGIY